MRTDVKTGIIHILSGSMKGMKIPIKDKETLYIGTDAQYSNIVLSEGYSYVSRTHCAITFDSKLETFYVVDMSSNGIFVEKAKIEKGRRTIVKGGQELLLANDQCKIILEIQETPSSSNDYCAPQETPRELLNNEYEQEKITTSKNNPILYISIAIASIFLVVILAIAGVRQDFSNFPIVGSQSENDDEDLSPSNIRKTVMIYFVGSDLETNYGAASMDIAEILDAQINTEKNNILVYTGGAKEWGLSNISSEQNSIYKLEENGLVLVESNGALNMGDSSTLSSFLQYGLSNYPADMYGLILWNHGAGPMIGYGLDEISGDKLTMSELTMALSDAGFGEKTKLEFLGFDACLMCSIETAWTVKDYANYLIASQETEPGLGWDYSCLEKLNYYDTGDKIGKEIIDAYFESYEEKSFFDWMDETELTLSCLNLMCIENVETSMNDLFVKVEQGIDTGDFSQISRCRANTKSFGKYSTGFDYDLVDLYHLVELLKQDYKEEANNLLNDLDVLVEYSKSNIDYANGVSIYHPYENTEYMSEWLSEYQSFNFAKDYTEYILDFGDKLKNPQKGITTLKGNDIEATKNKDVNVFTMQLTQEQADCFVKAQYYVLRHMGDEEYLFMFSGYDVTLDETNTLSASYDNKAVFVVDDAGIASSYPIMMYQVDDADGEARYYANTVMYNTSSDSISHWKIEGANWQIKIENGTPKLLNIYPSNAETTGFPSKQSLDYQDYTSVQFVAGSRNLTRDNDGNMLPYYSWESTSMGYGIDVEVKYGIHFECRDIEETDGYYVMFVVEDINGNQYASELQKLK